MELKPDFKHIAFRQKLNRSLVQTEKEKIESRARFLKKCVKNEPSNRLNAQGKELIRKLFFELVNISVSNLEQKLLDLEILVANLLNLDRKPVMISLNNNSYNKVKSRYKREKSSYFTVFLVKALHNANYIHWQKGIYDHVLGVGKMTRIWPTDELSEYFELLGSHRTWKLIEPVHLKAKENDKGIKELVDYSDTVQTIRLRDDILKINKLNDKHRVEVDCPDFPKYCGEKIDTQLYAVYNNSSWKKGGRLYTSEHGYQKLKKELRPFLTIDGIKTTELDYSELHIRMLYALYAQEGIQYPIEKDPYACLLSYTPALRKYFKLLLLTFINADSIEEATKGINNDLRKIKNWQMKRQATKLNLTYGQLLDEFTHAHPMISKHFLSGIGLDLQNIDSKMALYILKHFTKKRIPILSIHDSFIVQSQYKDELRTVMDTAFKKYANGFVCPIKEK